MTRGIHRDKWFGRGKHGPRRGERGSNLVEQSFIIVFLLTMLFGIVEFGRAMYTYHFVSTAAREASRWASVRGSRCSALPDCNATPSDVQTTFSANMSSMGLDPSKISFVTTWVAPPGVTSGSCTPGKNDPGCAVNVDVTYSYKFLFPFLPSSTVTMKSQSQMVITQ